MGGCSLESVASGTLWPLILRPPCPRGGQVGALSLRPSAAQREAPAGTRCRACSQLHPPARGPPPGGHRGATALLAAMRGPQALFLRSSRGRTVHVVRVLERRDPRSCAEGPRGNLEEGGRREQASCSGGSSAAPRPCGCPRPGAASETRSSCNRRFPKNKRARPAGLWKGAAHPSHQDCSEAPPPPSGLLPPEEHK